MGNLKRVLVWTNPFLYIFGAPVFVGFILAAMTDGVAKKTTKICKSIDL